MDRNGEKGYDYLFKLLIIGDAGVGKSAILIRFADNTFSTSYINTIGVDFKIRTIEINGERIKLQIWDTAGQERFRTITSTYYRGTNGIVVVFDVTSDLTFLNIKKWLMEIDENDCLSVPRVLVGNKIDSQKRVVLKDDAEKLAKSKKLAYFESSAKDNVGISEIFLHLTQLALAKKMGSNQVKDESEKMDLNLKKKKKSGCC